MRGLGLVMKSPADIPYTNAPSHRHNSDGLPTSNGSTVSICLVGGRTIIRQAIRQLLESPDISVAWAFDDEQALARAVAAGQADGLDLIVLIPGDNGLSSFNRLGDMLASEQATPPVVVLGEQLSRGQIYGALRMGAKAYVTLNSQPEELRQAIHLAAEGKMHLSRDAAEMMLSDISNAHHPARAAGGTVNAQLSAREIEVVQLLCDGLSSKQIAARLHLAPKTVENHRYNIYRKCRVESIAGLIRYAVQHGMATL